MIDWLDDFLVRSILAGLMMVSIAAPMGCLMVWQRLAFLSDTLGHAAVLGVGIGLLLEVNPMLSSAFIIVDESTMKIYRDALKPHRGEIVD